MVVVIAGNVASSAAFDFTDGMRKAIPVGFTLSIGAPRPFNLVGGGCQAPKKSIRKSSTVYLRGCQCAGNVFLRERTSGSKSTVGQQSAAGSDKRVLNKSSAVHPRTPPTGRERTTVRFLWSNGGLALPAQTVDATPSNQLIRQY